VFLIAGLGNPGEKYRRTRHNMGFEVVEQWGKMLGASLKSRRFQSKSSTARLQHETIILLQPVTYMNRSGQAIRSCMDYYRLRPDQILIIHDDIDLPTGKIKLVWKGGGGGHKGVQSIISAINTDCFPRLKIGVGRPRYGEDVEDYVLASFYPDERRIMDEVVPRAISACQHFINKGIERAMNQVNTRKFAASEGTEK